MPSLSQFDIQQRLITLDDFPIPQLNTTRRIRVLLPESYAQSDARYPVIYFQDGRNAFFDQDAKYGTSWRVQDELAAISRKNPNQEYILVAIDNSSAFDFNGRLNEYSPWVMDADFALPSRDQGVYQMGGLGDAYAEFVANDLRKHIDATFRTLDDRLHRTVIGSSMGGLISLYMAMTYNELFGAVGVFSPAFWFNKPQCLAWLDKIELSQSLRIYMDIGTHETSDEARDDFSQIYVDDAKQFAEILDRMGNVSLAFLVSQDDIHNERAWQKRFPNFIAHCT